MFNKEHCSPRKEKIQDSCLSKTLLIKFSKILNKNYGANIKIKKRSKKKIFEEISEFLNNKNHCSTESCWINIELLSKHLSSRDIKKINAFFKPREPKEWIENPNTWLTTTDINNVMEQYEKKYPHFKYYGATPIDFNLKFIDNTCKVSDLCEIDLKKLKNKKCIGMVFNTDTHNKSGQHWFSMFIDMKGINMDEPAIYYFDSAKPIKNIEAIPVQIIKLIEKLQIQNNYKFNIYFNDIRHQYGNTECGVYCLHFLTEMLKGKCFLDYKGGDLTDKKIASYRKKFFINININK